MKGGFNNPPNREAGVQRRCADEASMKGGFNNPPNNRAGVGIRPDVLRFNEGGVQ